MGARRVGRNPSWAGSAAGRAGREGREGRGPASCIPAPPSVPAGAEGEVTGLRHPGAEHGQDRGRVRAGLGMVPHGRGGLMPRGVINQWDFCPGFRDAGGCPGPQVRDEGWDVQPGDPGLPIPIPTPQQGIRSLLPPPKGCGCHPPRWVNVPFPPPAPHHPAGYQGRWHGDEDASPAAGLAPAGRCFVRTPGPLRRRDKPKNSPSVPNIPSASSRRPRRRSSPLVSFPQQRAGESFLFSPRARSGGGGLWGAGRKGRTRGQAGTGSCPPPRPGVCTGGGGGGFLGGPGWWVGGRVKGGGSGAGRWQQWGRGSSAELRLQMGFLSFPFITSFVFL